MLTFLYLNDPEGCPHITTCPFNKLLKKAKGYYSNCGADWWSVAKLTQEDKFEDMVKLLSSIDFERIPSPKGHEVIELQFKPLEYNIISDEKGN